MMTSSFLLLLFTLHITVTSATTSLFTGQSLSGNQTLISGNSEFTLGFFSPQNTSTNKNYYLGIWFNKFPNQPFWIANRDTPVSNPNTTQLTISPDGNLVLLEQSKAPVWSSNLTKHVSTNTSFVVTLLDTGNLALTNSSNSSDIVWQSFDYPTDTLMAGQWFGLNPATGVAQSLTSWKNVQHPSTGAYTFELYPPGGGSSAHYQYVLIWNHSMVYDYFEIGLVPSIVNMPFNVNYNYDYNGYQFRYTVKGGGPNYTRYVMGANGQIQTQSWFDSSNRWIVEWTIPADLCAVYSACGAFGICEQTSANQYCTCLPGFEPDSPSYWDVINSWDGSSCVRKSSLQCESKNSSANSNQDGFLPVPSIVLPYDGYELLQHSSHKHCESACFNSCSCSAYAFTSNQCMIFHGEIRDLKRDSLAESVVLYLRLAASDLPNKRSKKELAYKIAVAATVGAVVLVSLSVCLVVLIRRRIYQKTATTNGYINQFSYTFLTDCTKKYSETLGKGSFGSVFKGQFSDSTPIAVKRLEGSRQGEKQFRTEVRTLGKIQHVSLVQLLGFSLKGVERLLVYSYMPNGSLDAHLFNNSTKNLNWKVRFQIIQGVARGLAYLHEDCRECIIHCDIKPENILLDGSFLPKISDFGLAKLMGREIGEVLTTTRGTLGYLAPEWISGIPITAKVDVYSYGMMLFEIVSGRRNRKQTKNGYFPVWALKNLSSDHVELLLDERLEGEADFEQVARVLYAAGWCIQDNESHRPTMKEVLRILDGSLPVLVAPIPRSLENITCDEDFSNYLCSYTE